ncbi:MAG: Do family serine endopeptidase [Alphaproteobacteria bacterium]|nr:Do family serine endopeptidase [Alphaproteobacteria bacterium]
MMQTPTPKRRLSKLPAFLAAAALLGTTAYTLPGFLEQPANAATDLSKTFDNGAPAAGFADLVERVQPAVVSVQVKGGTTHTARRKMPRLPRGHGMEDFFKQFEDRQGGKKRRSPRRQLSSHGSGFVVTEDGFVVTNNHVLTEGGTIQVKFANGDEHEAELIGSDAKTDLALLKIKAKGKSFPFVRFAEKAARVGDWVVAVGNPFGLGGTVTTGIISARGRDIGSGPYDDFLQIDAAINKGNSGGPAFNLKGEVVGVNTAIFSPSGGSVGIGFAIPAHLAGKIVADLKDDGNVTRGWLGVVIQSVTQDIAESLGLDQASGVIIADVQDGSPASKAGLRSGDTILTLEGKKVKSPRDLARKVAAIKPGEKPSLELIRDGKTMTKEVTIAKLPGKKKVASAEKIDDEPKVSLASLGLELSPTDGQGVAVVDVDPAGPAAAKGLRPGDHILEVSGIEVEDPQSVASAIERADRKGRKSVLLLVRSGENQRFVAIPLKQV